MPSCLSRCHLSPIGLLESGAGVVGFGIFFSILVAGFSDASVNQALEFPVGLHGVQRELFDDNDNISAEN